MPAPGRFSFNFHNGNTINASLYATLAANASKNVAPPSRYSSLTSPMIDRVHKARAGCSACGKKVA